MAVWGKQWADRWNRWIPRRNRPRAISEVNKNEGDLQPQRLGAGREASLTLVSVIHSASICKGSHVSSMVKGDTDMIKRGRNSN